MKVQLIHWKAEEADARLRRLRKAGLKGRFWEFRGMGFLERLRKDPPAVIVIDLSRLPSQGRDVAFAIRRNKALRQIPIVFAGGDESKAKAIGKQLPDASFCRWEAIGETVGKAAANPPEDPVVPDSALAGYSGTPLPRKLGIKEGMRVALCRAPEDFQETLGDLPDGVALLSRLAGRVDLILFFVRSRSDLSLCLRKTASRGDFRRLWVIWPKKSSGMQSEITQQDVRSAGLARGLVDFKICAVDQTWSGLAFTRRKT